MTGKKQNTGLLFRAGRPAAAELFCRWLYPAHCAMCDGLLGRTEKGICTSCRQHVSRGRYPFPGGTAAFPYKGVYRDAVRRFKYGGRPEYAAFFADAIICAAPELLSVRCPDVLVPVPIHRDRFRERGYNQAEELARELSLQTQIPYDPGLVVRLRNTKPQSGLDPDGRRKNIQGAFSVRRGAEVPKRVLIVDDIRTTGSTIAEMEKVLTAHGAGEVRAVCICLAADDR